MSDTSDNDPGYPTAKSLFRHFIVSLVLALIGRGWGRGDAVREVASRPHHHGGQVRQVSVRSIYRWLKRYEEAGFSGLQDAPRQSTRASHVLSKALLDFIASEHQSDPDASIPELIRRARQYGVISESESIDRTTVWRAMKRMGLDTRRRALPPDTRAFEYQDRLQMVMSDFVRFRAGEGRLKRLAIYFLDDATRYGIEVVVSTESGEGLKTVLRAFHAVIEAVGRFDCLYVDRGAGFVAHALHEVCAKLGIHCILGRAGYPEGRGKIERFNRSVRARELRSLTHPDVDPTFSALTLRLRHDLHQIYNHRPHEGIDGDTPYERWHSSQRRLQPIASDELERAFRQPLERKVTRHHLVSIDGVDYEVPRGLCDKKITIQRHLLEQDTEDRDVFSIRHRGEQIRLHPVDRYRNATSRRGLTQKPAAQESAVPKKTASHLAYDRALRPMTGPDGGYSDSNDQED